jgi:cell division protease FtsH
VATFGKSSAKLAPEEGTGVGFGDVAGVDEAIEELQEIVQFLRTPEKFTVLGGKIPKGVLLVGPPGTGKTLLARAVAGEAKVPFFSISGSDFVEMFVGVGAARVRDLFQKAAEHAPCIIFIDELDAVGKARGGASPVGGHDEREQTLNQILVEMDGFDGRKGIIIVAATNRPEILDPALLRAGRFDRQVLVDRPDVRGREAILQVHSRNLKLGPDVDLSKVARMTPGFAGADLANTLNEAALLAARQDKKAIELCDIDAAVERIVAGLEKKSRRLSQKEKRVVAFHEAGHAICAAGCPGADPVQKISIIPRGIGALGYTLQTPLEDRYLMTRQELLNRLIVLYGGRSAEELVFGEVTTGASDDIRKASDLARRMVSQFGMSEHLGPIDYGGERPNPFGVGGAGRDIAISERTAREIDEEVRHLLQDAWRRARRILAAHRPLMDRMAAHLLEREVLERDDLAAFLAEVGTIDLTEEIGSPPVA